MNIRLEIKSRINIRNAFYYSLEKILSLRLLSKKLKVNTYKTIILPVVKLMPGFSKVRYRFYSDIDRLTAVLALHERKIAHPFDKCLLT